jgi:phosphoserine aminotransferase
VTSNETIHGVQWHAIPDLGPAPLVCDASSDIFSGPIDVSRFGLIYAGAQKNLGPSGLTVVIVREDLLERSPDSLPSMLSYKVEAASHSLYNTPNVFGVYILRLVMKWLIGAGGLAAMRTANERKAALIYAELDRSGFWRPHADKDSRSLMNVTFRLPSDSLDALFVKEAAAAGLDGLKGHRTIGGLRASIYNAFPEAGVRALVDFMRDFERKHG